MRKILFASSEVYPLSKTGGLADVSASLPIALHQHGHDVRVVMPAYRAAVRKLSNLQTVATIKLDGFYDEVKILQGQLPDTGVTLWLVDSPYHFDREGGPYSQPEGDDWHDNAARFALFARAVATIAMNESDLGWQPDVLHCNDWQTGLAPALIAGRSKRPRTVFTIHNLAYQGLYSHDVFVALDLPDKFWHPDGLEFYGMLSFMKGGLIFADHITTVSPTYAREICSYEYGYGLEGLLSHRNAQGRLSGILNGIDTDDWNPRTDTYISKTYSIKQPRNKKQNKSALQQRFFLAQQEDTLLVGLVSRLVAQKGIDLSLAAVTTLLANDAKLQVVCLGSGEADFEHDLRVLQARYPDRVAVEIGYDEALAHQIEAGSDVFLMPSRFEPCGLNQMYSLRYGTLPIVRNTGGLADTVIDANEENRKNGTANGFKFEQPTPEALVVALENAIALFGKPRIWRKMMLTAMAADLSWENSAREYLELYEHLINQI